jgi:hypothetical protein
MLQLENLTTSESSAARRSRMSHDLVHAAIADALIFDHYKRASRIKRLNFSSSFLTTTTSMCLTLIRIWYDECDPQPSESCSSVLLVFDTISVAQWSSTVMLNRIIPYVTNRIRLAIKTYTVGSSSLSESYTSNGITSRRPPSLCVANIILLPSWSQNSFAPHHIWYDDSECADLATSPLHWQRARLRVAHPRIRLRVIRTELDCASSRLRLSVDPRLGSGFQIYYLDGHRVFEDQTSRPL